MSVTVIFPFDSPGNYIFDSNKIEVSGGAAKLKLIDNEGLNFSEDFAVDTGFSYNPILTEILAGLRQKDQRPANSILGATYTDGFDLSFYADGFVDPSPILNGSPTIVGGKLVCSGNQGVCYQDPLIASLQADWVAKFVYTPNYNGGPAANVNLFSVSQATGGVDDVVIFNSPSGNNIRITANGLGAVTFGAWSAVSGQPYVFEVHCINNQVSIFIDNVQLGSAQTITPGQGTSSNFVHLGAYPTTYNVADGAFDDFVLYSTAPQTDVYTVPEAAYLEDKIEIPEFQYSSNGDIQELDLLSVTEGFSPRYTIQVNQSGNYLYWDSAAWSLSNETYSEANTLSDINTNIPSLNVTGSSFIQLQIITGNSADQMTAEALNLEYTGQIFPIDNPTIEPVQSFLADELINLLEESTKPGSDEIKYILKGDSSLFWYDGNDFVTSDGTYLQSNTAAELIAVLPAEGGVIRNYTFVALLHSDNGITTPDLELLSITYDAAAELPDDLDFCEVTFDNFQTDGDSGVKEIRVYLGEEIYKYKDSITIEREEYILIPNSSGRATIALVDNEQMEPGAFYNVVIGSSLYKISVPNSAVVNFWDIVI